MPRTPLANQLQEMVSIVQESVQRNISTEQALEDRRTQSVSRRDVLKLGLAGVSALALSSLGVGATRLSSMMGRSSSTAVN